MKKIVTLCAISAMALTLVGCKDASVDITKSEDVLVDVAGTKITKGEIFEVTKKSYGASYTLNEALNMICDKENIKIDDAMKKSADEQLATLKESAGEDFSEQLKAAGYKSEKDYMEKELYPSLRKQKLVTNYVHKKQDAMFKTYAPRKVEIMQAETKEKATTALAAIKDGTSVSEAAQANGTTTTYKGEETIYTSKSGLTTALFDKIKAAKKTGVIDEVIEDTTTSSFYVVNVTNIDPTSFKEEAMDAIVETGSNDLTTASSLYYLKKYEFEVYDKDIYDGLKQQNEKYVEY